LSFYRGERRKEAAGESERVVWTEKRWLRVFMLRLYECDFGARLTVKIVEICTTPPILPRTDDFRLIKMIKLKTDVSKGQTQVNMNMDELISRSSFINSY